MMDDKPYDEAKDGYGPSSSFLLDIGWCSKKYAGIRRSHN